MDTDRSHLPEVMSIRPLSRAPDVSVRVPGSKSITNRALLCAALARGSSTLTGVLFADDTLAMIGAVEALGAKLDIDEPSETVTVTGTDPRATGVKAYIDARQSGTTSRFMLPALALSAGRSTVDGSQQLRDRPFGSLIDALRHLGAQVEDADRPGHLPVAVTGPLRGGRAEVPGHVSSQFLSGLLMAGPLMEQGLRLHLTSSLVSVPYLQMTAAVMRHFGINMPDVGTGDLHVGPGAYRGTDYAIEPDASAASYFLGAAALSGGRVTVEGLGTGSLQGDLAFADVLERMGASVQRSTTSTTITGPATLRGVDVDMSDISDTAQTMAAVAVFADTPSRVRGIGFIRGKETDRIRAIVTELTRAGVDAVEHDDGFTVCPGLPTPTRFATYDDHRMAMSLSLLGLRAPGIEVQDPGCVSKTYPNFFIDLRRLG